jgi:mRNA-degrading endonuclease RelE of RelBE toxin-antitoxin system
VGEKRFKIIFSPAAQRDIERFEADEGLQLARDIKTYLELSPFPLGKTRIKKLTGFIPPLYRLRSGDFGVYYRIVGKEIVILATTHKKDSEKCLKKIR